MSMKRKTIVTLLLLSVRFSPIVSHAAPPTAQYNANKLDYRLRSMISDRLEIKSSGMQAQEISRDGQSAYGVIIYPAQSGLAASMGIQGRERVEERFSMAEMLCRIEALYEEAG